MNPTVRPPRAAARRAMLAAAGALALAASGAAAQPAWPSRPITLVSPYPAGGITDVLSRIVAEELSRGLGQPVLVENRVGAGGGIALQHVARAAADGYTLVMGGSAPSTILPALKPDIGYHPLRDFEPIGYVAGLPIVLVSHPSLPARTVPELVAYTKANAAQLNCAHHGNGTGTHLACLQFAKRLGVALTDVPYKGAPQVNVDLLANRVQLYFGTLPTQLGYVRAGQLRAYGIASAERAPAAPEIPTLAEQGLDGLELDSWNALYAPAGTPRPVLERLERELARIVALPEVRRRIEATGSVPRAWGAERLGRLTRDEYEGWRRLAAEARLKID